LLDGDLPVAHLLGDCVFFPVLRFRSIQDLPDSSGCLWRAGFADVLFPAAGFRTVWASSAISGVVLTLRIGIARRSLVLLLLFEQVVYLFRAHPAKSVVVEQHVFGQREPGIEQHRVDRVVAGHVPAPWIAPAAAGVMLQRRVHDFMGQSTGNLGCAQSFHELRIEVQGNAIGRHGSDRAASLRAQAEIAAGTFRSDLYYRLNVFPIEMPALRERGEDIPLLVEYFIDRNARKAGKSFQAVSKKSLDLLQSYPWPGNIRELQNVIERSVIVCETVIFSVDESWLSRQPLATERRVDVELSAKLAVQEKQMIEAALRESRGRVSGPSGAAAKLGIHRSTLDSKIASLKINKHRFNSTSPSKNS
jgi:hypothetical protein